MVQSFNPYIKPPTYINPLVEKVQRFIEIKFYIISTELWEHKGRSYNIKAQTDKSGPKHEDNSKSKYRIK